MGNLVPAGLNFQKKREVSLALFGLDNAGKSTVLANLNNESTDVDICPTLGFNSCLLTRGRYHIRMLDLGGAANIRGIWHHYYAESHGVIFVVDSADQERFSEVYDALVKTMKDERMWGKPLLVLANKQDQHNALCAEDFFSQLKLNAAVDEVVDAGGDLPATKLWATTALKSATGNKPDPRLRKSMGWMLGVISKNWRRLNNQVLEQYGAQEAEAQRARDERRRRREEREKAEEEAELATAAALEEQAKTMEEIKPIKQVVQEVLAADKEITSVPIISISVKGLKQLSAHKAKKALAKNKASPLTMAETKNDDCVVKKAENQPETLPPLKASTDKNELPAIKKLPAKVMLGVEDILLEEQKEEDNEGCSVSKPATDRATHLVVDSSDADNDLPVCDLSDENTSGEEAPGDFLSESKSELNGARAHAQNSTENHISKYIIGYDSGISEGATGSDMSFISTGTSTEGSIPGLILSPEEEKPLKRAQYNPTGTHPPSFVMKSIEPDAFSSIPVLSDDKPHAVTKYIKKLIQKFRRKSKPAPEIFQDFDKESQPPLLGSPRNWRCSSPKAEYISSLHQETSEEEIESVTIERGRLCNFLKPAGRAFYVFPPEDLTNQRLPPLLRLEALHSGVQKFKLYHKNIPFLVQLNSKAVP